MRGVLPIALCVALAASGCMDEGEIPAGGEGRVAPRGPKPSPKSPETKAPGEGEALAAVAFTDDDFVESESNRDPFRSYETTFQVKAPEAPQRLVLMPEVGIEQMRLIAIVSGANRPRAMLVDPTGVGHVAARGDFLGRAEVVQTGGRDSLPVTVNWRVDRIRSTEVVLAREDPASPNRAPLTRVIPLYGDEAPTGTLESSDSGGGDVPDFARRSSGG